MSELNRLYDKWMAAEDTKLDADLVASQLQKEYHAAYASSTREEKRAHLICLNGHDWDLED